ncbi:MAG: DUF1549 and DUF1553 domain-containing protein [Planctomycetaceae bacterium]
MTTLQAGENHSATEGSSHWSFQPPERQVPPAVKNTAWARNAIDAFILANLEASAIEPAPEADRSTLIRRLSLDLLGLPPTPAEVNAFLSDTRDDAYERLVERLLASPHFGERWGRHWLDLARYGDSDGYEKDSFRPDAWRFRNWVIDAINADMPFDQFTIEQLAGDLLPGATPDQLVATGFHRQTLINTEGGVDQEEFRVNANLDRVATTGAVWLGLTMFCSQCHDHKYDPISTADFYRVFAFFNNANDSLYNFPASGPSAAEFEQNLAKHQAEMAKLEREIEQEKQKQTDPTGNLKQLVDQWMRKEREMPRSPAGSAMVMREREAARVSHVLNRGDFMQPGQEVSPGTLAVLHRFEPKGERSTRLDLAHWLVDPRNPLTARVAVNRIWRHLFGRGIVSTVDNFGVMGEAPTHPELLGWLATEYVRLGWSRKAIIRAIVTSAAYRQSSRARAELAADDPDNSGVARQARFRVDAEVVRDLYLAAGGLLWPVVGGKSIRPILPPSVAEVSYASSVKWEVTPKPERYKRGLYVQIQRTVPYPSLTAFDCPDGVLVAPSRNRSNTPLQSLTLLNDPVFFECTQAMGRRILDEGPADDRGRLQFAARLALSRPLADPELARLEYLLAGQRERFSGDAEKATQYAGLPLPDRESATAAAKAGPVETAAWVSVSSVLMNLDEFLTRE